MSRQKILNKLSLWKQRLDWRELNFIALDEHFFDMGVVDIVGTIGWFWLQIPNFPFILHMTLAGEYQDVFPILLQFKYLLFTRSAIGVGSVAPP